MDPRRLPSRVRDRRRGYPTQSTAGLLGLAVLLAAVGVFGTASASAPRQKTAQAHRATNRICGTLVGHPVRVSHVIWVVMENRSYGEVIHAPYISSLASRCGVATNYHNITHPSLPNYIAMTSGRPRAALPGTDCSRLCPQSGPSIFTQTRSWKVFAESMPGNCVRHDARPYVVHHTAAPYYTAITNCATNDVP